VKYRKKPVVIEAVKWNGKNLKECNEFIDGKEIHLKTTVDIWKWDEYCNIVEDQGGIIIKTLEGNHLAKIGDYIIKGIKGEFYPCKPDIFELTYEEVQSE